MKDIHPTIERFISRAQKEKQLNQNACVYWLFGQSGTGKTTIAIELEKALVAHGKFVIVLDGDNLRSGLNAGLGFSTEDRMENIRRVAELAKIMVQNGIIVICCFVCPLESMRDLAKKIIGDNDFKEIYVKTSLETLISRDTKGFYKKAIEGKMENLTGINSSFEEPLNPSLVIDTDEITVNLAVLKILNN